MYVLILISATISIVYNFIYFKCLIIISILYYDFTIKTLINWSFQIFQLFTLWSWLPVRITMYQPILLYTTEEHGCSLTTFYFRVEQHEPTLLMIKTCNNEVSFLLKKLYIIIEIWEIISYFLYKICDDATSKNTYLNECMLQKFYVQY